MQTLLGDTPPSTTHRTNEDSNVPMLQTFPPSAPIQVPTEMEDNPFYMSTECLIQVT